jgi:hypothetical protein
MARVDRVPGRVVLAVIFIAMMAAQIIPANAENKDAAAAATAVQDAAKKGFPLTSNSTDVTGNISVEATLIPAKIGRTIFGKEVANNYAIISLTISNRSSDDSFIAHTIFIDYSQWLLSGSSEQSAYLLCTESQASSSEAKAEKTDTAKQSSGESGKAAQQCLGNVLRPWQQQTLPNQISTVETRIVRGELLDRQPWTTRNWVLRALQGVGSVAAAFTFVTTNQDWIRGIGAYNGNFIPAAQTFWPDATVGQMNRISDFGFQVNKVIAKQSSDIVVAFFPIERFLTPGLRELFLKSPSVFFSPYGMMLDPKHPKLVDQILLPIFRPAESTTNIQGGPTADQGATERKSQFLRQLPYLGADPCKAEEAKAAGANLGAAANPGRMTFYEACKIAELLDRTSLNTVRVIVGGTMTVDVNKVPPQITKVDIDVPAGKDATTMWTITEGKPTTLTGVIRGSFLGGGTPAITNVDSSVLEIKGDSQGSSDTELHFTITLKKDLPPGTAALTFEVSKKSGGATINSATKGYMVQTVPPAKG